MKLYKRQIRPMISPPAIRGMDCSDYPIEDVEIWYDEDYDFSKDMKTWQDYVLRQEGPWAKIVFQERYVPVTKNDFVKHTTTFDFDDRPICGFHDD